MEKTMSMPVTDLSQLDPDGFYSYSDYLMWQFKERVELIKGRLLRMSPAPNTAHQKVSQAFNHRLLNFFYGKPCQVFTAPFDVRLPVSGPKGQDTTVVQPDLCVICDESKLDEKGCVGAPDLIIEILSPGNSQKEMREKFQAYEEAGVREYWMASPSEKVVWRYILNDEGRFIGLAPATMDDTWASHLFPELVMDANEIFVV